MKRNFYTCSHFIRKAAKSFYQIPLLLLISCCFFISTPSLHAQVIGKDTLILNCPSSHCLNIVILGDGYTASEMDKFVDDAETVTNRLFEEPPFENYKNYFNVFLVRVASQESGIKHGGTADDCPDPDFHPVSNPNNYFGTRFDVGGIHRLVVPANNGLVVSTLATTFPNYDIVMILGNTPFYGGSGGSFATTTMHTSATLIAIHELGHSFSGLADEYYAGAQFMNERPNLTQDNNPGTIKWNSWLTPETGIGIHPHTGDDTWFKPTHHNCMMEQLNKPFCEVCSETTTYKILQLVSPIVNKTPAAEEVTIYGNSTFSLDLLLPVPNTLQIQWELNGNFLPDEDSSLELDAGLLEPGLNILAANVTDLTTLIRKNPPENYAAWSVYYDPTSTSAIENDIRPFITPNPAHHSFRVYTGRPDPVDLHLVNLMGHTLRHFTAYTPGTEIHLQDLPAGLYFIRFTLSGAVFTEKLLVF